MKPDNETSTIDSVFEVLAFIWNPGMEAVRVQRDLNVKSLEEMIAALERAGYEVCYVDLPEAVSGFATVIEEKRFIVVNRAKPKHHAQYTVPHELGHHILHLSPSPYPNPQGIPSSEDLHEFQAHMFAASWVLKVDAKERDEVLKQNPESVVLLASVGISLGVILFAVLAHLASYVFRTRLSQPETKT
jgi:Zn-dependent peptidase ImmA (M78 family)